MNRKYTDINISIIMPLYNSEKYLMKSLDSIVKQTIKNFELIIINDASTDLSLEIVNKYRHKITSMKIINSVQNKGVSYARNLGLSYAQGEYICFIDSDDIIIENFLEIMYKTAQKYKSDIVCCNYYYINDKNRKRKNFFSLKGGTYLPNDAINYLLKDTFLHFFVWNKMFKKEIIQHNNIIFINKCFEDVIFTLKSFYYANKIYIIDKPLYYYRKHSLSLSQITSYEKVNEYIESLTLTKDFLLEKGIYNLYESSYIFLTLRFLMSCFYKIPCIYFNSKMHLNITKFTKDTILSLVKLITNSTNF